MAESENKVWKLKVWKDGGEKAFVFGHQFGPMFVAITDSLESAIDEWDERCGQRVDNEDIDLKDYGEEDPIGKAMECGDIRINDGGTIVWVDQYEWIREFPDIAEAFSFANDN